jgi:NAD dependent epimerase/dehydratase family enzyme
MNSEHQRHNISSATGIVGCALVKELLSQKKEVSVLVRIKKH